VDNRARWVLLFFGFFVASFVASRWTYGRTIELWEGALLAFLLFGTAVTGFGAARAFLKRWVV
jgi:hypothetical protein